jgi:hypothetical protein
MRITEFKKLEEKITGQNFNKSYKNINLIMTVLSYFGHVASIFLAYFMLSKVISGAMTDNKVAVFIATVIILGGLELLKRDIFDKFSIQYLKIKTFGKDVMPLFLLSIAIIGASFYASITGAHEYASKDEIIKTETKTIKEKYVDSLFIEYKAETATIEQEINSTKESKKKNELLLQDLQAMTKDGSLSKDQRATKKDITSQNNALDKTIADLENKIKGKKDEMDKKVKKYDEEITAESKDKKENNSKNTLAFVIISTLIEIIILAGVYFNEYYKFRSYREFRDKIEKDPNFQKWMLYDQIMNIIYTEDTKMNQKLPSVKGIIESCKVNDIIVMNKDVTNFLKTATALGIVKVSGSTRYISKQRDLSFETLRKNFNIE